METDDHDGEDAGHVVADRDFLLRNVLVLPELRLVPRVHHRAVSSRQGNARNRRELGELQLRHLQKQVLGRETGVRGVVDAQATWNTGSFRTVRQTGKCGSREDCRRSLERGN